MKRTCATGRAFHLLHFVLAAVLVLAFQGMVDAANEVSRQVSFSSPEEAAQALFAALKNSDEARLAEILGPGSESLISSGDVVADRAGRAELVKLYEAKNHLDMVQGNKAVLLVGAQDYPLPIPVVKQGESWIFDTNAGRKEILNRRMGKNELEAIEILDAYVEAQREYSARAHAPGRPSEYAQQLLSTPGKKDGLYWEAKEGEEESPLGPLVAQAAREGYMKPEGKWPVPFHGYYFRILKGQGRNAPGGAFDYVVNGRMVRGFGMVAYPARYGASGIMTFIVNQDGVVYQKDLGQDTPKVAPGMQLFDPDKSWSEVGGDGESLPTVSDLALPQAGSAEGR
ncbi:DUF2950 domain-containing protein [Geomonas sp. RF6]|uniref:DUF2950 domain-containing protein n=1 Tax=Geomonas sp. RF6 TaxID=2897342 RepID=UPI001E565132|nr:DUF2950 domain-containing protein [Geomonas sp. RF6]UFS71700.1 DUF2950 domain-containing protein [Geomonas sp. RF6]